MRREKLLVATVLIAFWMNFCLNAFHIVSPGWFFRQNRDMESYVVGRLMVSRQYGVFYKAGLTGIQRFTHMDFIAWQMPFTLLGFGLSVGRTYCFSSQSCFSRFVKHDTFHNGLEHFPRRKVIRVSSHMS
jgi:hypothetical protein